MCIPYLITYESVALARRSVCMGCRYNYEAQLCACVYACTCKPVEMHDFIRSFSVAHMFVHYVHMVWVPCCWGTFNVPVHANCMCRGQQALQRDLEDNSDFIWQSRLLQLVPDINYTSCLTYLYDNCIDNSTVYICRHITFTNIII